ncbi:hypothetical protein GCM10009633_19320 [Janibacter melonis]|uniref:hypothetical protein n=1 Tax=Janibacter melonis TaxID=262209 RepID=UPI001E391A55|nr:hypothetical protein [Janibacter melonis]MCB5991751.1 hypothetical protein [Janibacter melonis]
MTTWSMKAVTVAASAATVLTIASVGAASAGDAPAPSPARNIPESPEVGPGPGVLQPPGAHEYGTNARGESYGSALWAKSPDDEPDLIRARASNGRIGYVRASEIEEADPSPKSPEEAAKNDGPLRPSVPVYESDGTTVIGGFRFSS